MCNLMAGEQRQVEARRTEQRVVRSRRPKFGRVETARQSGGCATFSRPAEEEDAASGKVQGKGRGFAAKKAASPPWHSLPFHRLHELDPCCMPRAAARAGQKGILVAAAAAAAAAWPDIGVDLLQHRS